jgi:hypothetical protein
MDDKHRGLVYNRERKSQIINYNGLRVARMTPTDLDGIMEFRDKLFVFFEYKGQDAPLQDGQQTCLERLVNAIQTDDRHAVCFIIDHFTHVHEDVDGANSLVRDFFYCNHWHKPPYPTTVRQLLDMFCNKVLGWANDTGCDWCFDDIVESTLDS